MASKNQASITLFLSLNLLFFALVSADCSTDILKFGACANILTDLVGVIIGTTPTSSCCSLIDGLVDLDAAVCLCTALKADVLGINLDIPLSLNILLNVCGKKYPTGYTC
ncbi:14 kDa proline-rich protein DC2.15 [Solanum lycopersicum]|uniref:Bifunctional inhibitor/plant lipid transfer protein/seed storage helical domain-containing protein n=2 Tax=Solanum subgen. Lycopersicon TaxID=49274 RepID=A0A3Q7FNH0_SOLLC|nr:14 kDa proline-rich protein DC2.15 [Solanum lycopersicum]XP_015069320.1 14 kDa proline-rich protein DC2.15-like [Solanum pennellii]